MTHRLHDVRERMQVFADEADHRSAGLRIGRRIGDHHHARGFDAALRDEPPSSEDLAALWRPYVETCIDAFGPQRCMFESDFPPDKQSCSYRVLWNVFKRLARSYSADEKSALFHDTAARVYRLSPLA